MHSRCLKISQFYYITALIVIVSCCLPLRGGSSSVGLKTDTISFNASSLRDPQTIESRNQLFKLGFYSPENTTNRYMAVFFSYAETKAVWIANRDRPLRDSSGVITVSEEGNLVLMNNGDDEVVWSTNITTTAGYNLTATAQILDSGNLVLYYDNSSTGKVIVWDSFSHPTQIWLPTMALTDDTNTGNKVMLSSWTDRSDPSVGSFRLGLQALEIPQFFIWHSDGRPHHRSGPWNGQLFTGELTEHQSLSGGGYRFSETSPGIFSLAKPPTELRCLFFLDAFGTLVPVIWNDQNRSWTPTLWTPANECDIYGKCGPFGVCDTRNSPAICSCLRGFEPVDKVEWDRRNWTRGCVRKTRLHGGSNNDNITNSNIGKEKEDGFLRLQYLKVPDFAEKFNSVDEEECRLRCLRNCCCIAYSYYAYNIGCMLWRERDEGLIDIQQFPAGVGLDLHLRLAASELDDGRDKIMIIVIPVIGIIVSVLVLTFIIRCWLAKKRGDKAKEQNSLSHSTGIFLQDVSERSIRIKELPLFAYKTLAIATNHFHNDNLLGKGGFGHVYRGQLKNRKEIAVKRLSKASSQGVEEFANEVHVISKLQHKNLVRLVGCCVEKDEKMLVYEYMPNKSLNLVLFDLRRPISSEILDWEKRLNIIKGIGRGLLYLHRDSRLRIIHRDLKASNVLLDQEWNPKISDFGIARIFDANQDQDNTVRVAGTFGYMSPEYAAEGRFSEKSDVYSFGVLMLEIISGKKNTHYYNHDSSSSSLLGCAWKFFMGDNGVPFMDENILNIHSKEEMIICTHIALLCVQEFAKERPTVQTVLSMLEGEIVNLPIPEQPLLSDRWNSTDDQSTNQNELTVTVLDGR